MSLRHRRRAPLRKTRILAVALALGLVAATASATELLDARISTAAAPALQNTGGSVRLEQPEWSAVGHRTFVPEPGVLFQQLGSGAVLLALLAIRRRRAASSTRHPGENLE